MRAYTLGSKLIAVRLTGLRVFRWAASGAGVGAIGGAIFGILFTAFMALLCIESYSVFGIASYFAVSGMAAGAALGVCGALLDPGTLAEPTETAPRIIERLTNRIADVDPITNHLLRKQRNRMAEHSQTDRSKVPAMASRNSFRN
ncbi:MAG TPA: hypothetical protein VGM05_02860 [Planctomycetaceae bacterium]|jgi:hypothetical protein